VYVPYFLICENMDQMISSEVPLLLAKATEIFALELTIRAWMHTEDNKRRTLQRNDIVMAVSRSDMYDFLIDIVPRQELSKKPAAAHEAAVPASAAGPSSLPAPTPSFFPPPSGGFAVSVDNVRFEFDFGLSKDHYK
jgi:nuclear transcription factor Y gamma